MTGLSCNAVVVRTLNLKVQTVSMYKPDAYLEVEIFQKVKIFPHIANFASRDHWRALAAR